MILIITPFAPPIGGITTWSGTLEKSYQNHPPNYKYIFLDSKTSIGDKVITNYLFKFFVVSFRVLLLYFKLLYYQFRYQISAIHINSSGKLSLLRDFIFVKSIFGSTNIFIQYHYGEIIQDMNTPAYRFLIANILKRCKKCFFFDTIAIDTLKALGYYNVEFLPNGIDLNFLSPTRKQSFQGFSSKTVLFVGHVIPSKGVFELILAANKIENLKKLIFIGPVSQELKSCLRDLSNGSYEVEFLGLMRREDIFGIMRSTSVLCLPSYTEGFPYVILEAFANGLPVISTDVGGISFMLDKGRGLLCQSKDIVCLSEALDRVLNDLNFRDELVNSITSSARDEFEISSVRKRMEAFWFNTTS